MLMNPDFILKKIHSFTSPKPVLHVGVEQLASWSRHADVWERPQIPTSSLSNRNLMLFGLENAQLKGAIF